MTRGNRNGEFAREVRAELRKRDWGVRTLAREMNPDNPESARRALNRWLSKDSPKNPNQANRAAVAVALGLSPDHFDGDEDEDESEQEIMAALMQVVRLLRADQRGRDEVAA